MDEPTVDEVRRYIAAGLPCTALAVEGDGRHFFATIVSAEFEGLNRVRRHQRVYAALGDRMREQVHALSMQTLTPAEYAAASPEAQHPPSAAGLHDDH
ncbi:MAG TPA: BolA/IbaG family iron-sulfur metabolism protein [Rubrivivax sp.]|nr:BolA/IbaG family iron-sulfur metabolism protein [Rubrivivax sp.]